MEPHELIGLDEFPYGAEVDEQCNCPGPHMKCTRAIGHKGPHIAMCHDKPMAVWVDIDAHFNRITEPE